MAEQNGSLNFKCEDGRKKKRKKKNEETKLKKEKRRKSQKKKKEEKAKKKTTESFSGLTIFPRTDCSFSKNMQIFPEKNITSRSKKH